MEPTRHPRRPRVLIADDYPAMIVALERLLSLSCDVVGTVEDSESLLEITRRLQPDVVLLDLNLPSGGSLVACREITRTVPRTKVIVLSGVVDSSVRPDVLAAGASAFIAKHTAAEELMSVIAQTQPAQDQ